MGYGQFREPLLFLANAAVLERAFLRFTRPYGFSHVLQRKTQVFIQFSPNSPIFQAFDRCFSCWSVNDALFHCSFPRKYSSAQLSHWFGLIYHTFSVAIFENHRGTVQSDEDENCMQQKIFRPSPSKTKPWNLFSGNWLPQAHSKADLLSIPNIASHFFYNKLFKALIITGKFYSRSAAFRTKHMYSNECTGVVCFAKYLVGLPVDHRRCVSMISVDPL